MENKNPSSSQIFNAIHFSKKNHFFYYRCRGKPAVEINYKIPKKLIAFHIKM